MPKLTYKELQHAVATLTKDVTRGAEAIRTRAQIIDGEALDTSRIAEMISGMGVDLATTGETRDLSRIMNGLSQAAIAYAAAGDDTARAFKAAADQAHTTHGGVQEAYTRAPVDMSNLDREWLRQE